MKGYPLSEQKNRRQKMDSKYDMLKLENQLCFPLYVCSKETIRLYKRFLDPLDLTYTQYIAMMVMWEHKSLTVKEMGKILLLDSGTLTPVLKKLESKGYLSRKRSKDDERTVMISITERGGKLKAEAAMIPKRMGDCIKLSQEEASKLKEILDKTLKNIERGK